MTTHPNAPLTPEGRRRLCERIDTGRPIAHVAAEGGLSRATLSGWYKRWLLYGDDGSRITCPHVHAPHGDNSGPRHAVMPR